MSFTDYLAQIIHFQLEQIQSQQFLWAQSFLLERQISSKETYQKSYAMMVQMWQNILKPFIQDNEQLEQISLNVQRICYGFVSQTLLIEPEFKDWKVLENEILQQLSVISDKGGSLS